MIKCFIPTEYNLRHFEMEYPSTEQIASSLKMALLLYDRVVVDWTTDRIQERLAQLLGLVPRDVLERLCHALIPLDSAGVPPVTLPTRRLFDELLVATLNDEAKEAKERLKDPLAVELRQSYAQLSTLHRAVYAAIVETEPGFDPIWRAVGQARALETAELIFLHAYPSETANLHFYTTREYSAFLRKVSRHLGAQLGLQPPAVVGPEVNEFQKMFFPNPSELSWEDVAVLRESDFRMSFQQAFFSGDESLPQVAEDINHHVVSKVFEVLHRHRPKKLAGVVARSVSSLPVPIIGINPLSAFREIRDGLREAAEYRLYGWLFFLAELAEAASRHKHGRDS